jgi:hypothetical protein
MVKGDNVLWDEGDLFDDSMRREMTVLFLK